MPQTEMVFDYDESAGLSAEAQEYDPTPILNEIRRLVDDWPTWPNPSDWKVTPETARFLREPKRGPKARAPANASCAPPSELRFQRTRP